MKRKGLLLITLGVIGALLVFNFDMIVGKPVNDISGPKSIIALLISATAIIIGAMIILKGKKK